MRSVFLLCDRLSGYRWHVLRLWSCVRVHIPTMTQERHTASLSDGYRHNVPCERDRPPQRLRMARAAALCYVCAYTPTIGRATDPHRARMARAAAVSC